MRTRHSIITTGIAALVACPATAHHSQAQFVLDPDRMETIRGTVTEFDFRNPHVYVYLEAQDADGSTVEWELEATSTPNLIRRGWSRNSIEVGEQLTVDIHPARDPSQHIARVGRVYFANGTSLSATEGGPEAPPDVSATSFAGRWWGRGSVRQFQMDRVDEPWPLTAKAQAALAAFDGSQNPQVDCIPMTAPTIMLYSNIFDVTLSDERLDWSSEWLGAERTIWLDGREHPPATERFQQGHSVGAWEDENTLVVDTTNYADHAAGLSFEIPSGAQKHTTERMTLSADGKRIDYEFVLEDPEYLTSPITGTGHWEYRPDLERQVVNCDREVARRFMERLYESE
jgi:hypothetical protein